MVDTGGSIGAGAALEAAGRAVGTALPAGFAQGQAGTVVGAGGLVFRELALAIAALGGTIGGAPLGHLLEAADAVAAGAAVHGAALRGFVTAADAIAAGLDAILRAGLLLAPDLAADTVAAPAAVDGTALPALVAGTFLVATTRGAVEGLAVGEVRVL